jgi:hypothetical protein
MKRTIFWAGLGAALVLSGTAQALEAVEHEAGIGLAIKAAHYLAANGPEKLAAALGDAGGPFRSGHLHVFVRDASPTRMADATGAANWVSTADIAALGDCGWLRRERQGAGAARPEAIWAYVVRVGRYAVVVE